LPLDSLPAAQAFKVAKAKREAETSTDVDPNRLHSSTKSRFPGVIVRAGQWHAVIKTHRTSSFLGPFDSEVEASQALDEARKANLASAAAAADPNHLTSQIKSTFKGVSVRNGKWDAEIMMQGKKVWLGPFESEADGARALENARMERKTQKLSM
jgi:hypothetical protein